MLYSATFAQGSWKAGYADPQGVAVPSSDRQYCDESFESGIVLCTFGHSPPGENLRNLVDLNKETKWLQYRSFKVGSCQGG